MNVQQTIQTLQKLVEDKPELLLAEFRVADSDGYWNKADRFDPFVGSDSKTFLVGFNEDDETEYYNDNIGED